MITAQDIYDATNGGQYIIEELYPQTIGFAEGTEKKKYALRDERTPSATIRKRDGVWKVTDFGGEGHEESPIDLYMKAHNLNFPEALARLAQKYDVTDELTAERNKPEWTERQATPDEKDDLFEFKFKDAFTEAELKVMGPLVKQEHCDALHWHSVESITFMRKKNEDGGRRVVTKHSTENYPIFARECQVGEGKSFYKFYEPLNPNKGFRFSYRPIGGKPRQYTNGLAELKRAYADFNAREEKIWQSTHDDDHPYKEKKLECAFICSGERDSMCCRSLGHHPLWFNSETYKMSVEEYKEIMKYVEVLYNIPDIDETGVLKGKELALRFIDIHTIWLPDWLSSYRDNRGKPRKDLRDWMELRQKTKDFKDLMTLAMPARFWVSRWNKKQEKEEHAIDTACLFNFLKLNGFYALKDDTSNVTKYVKIDGYIVKLVNVKDMREFVRKWVIERAEKRDVLNLVLNTPKLGAAVLESLEEIDLDFTSYTERSQRFYFPNVCVEISQPRGVKPLDSAENVKTSTDGQAYFDGFKETKLSGGVVRNFVWEENVIDHRFSKLPDMFVISEHMNEDGERDFDIDIKNVGSKFFGYLINSSRLYWRKEIEGEGDNQRDHDGATAYLAANKFNIAGQGLTTSEIKEQKQNLISKIFTLGYMLHRYKSPDRAWAPMALDNKIGLDDECNGRSGKSFFFKTLSLLMKSVKLSGRNPKLMDNPHVFDQVTKHTELLLIDDCDRYLNTGLFYDNITSDMTVNPKNNHSFTIPFEESPKLAFTTNYVPADFDPSSEARLLYMVFSDYYHQKTQDNDYNETRTIRDDFGKPLHTSGYTEDEWNADINFMLQCCRFYLSVASQPVKIQPHMANIIHRKQKADMGVNFEDWAYQYFSEESGRLDKFIPRSDALGDFRVFSQSNRITMQSFTRKLKVFAIVCDYIEEYNPAEYKNSSGRIIRRPDGDKNATPMEMIFMRSKKSLEAPGTEPEQQELDFDDSDEPF